MSRSRTRARNRRARLEQSSAEFARARDDPKALTELLGRLAGSNTPVWPVAKAAAKDRPLDDDENAMIAEKVSPRLAGGTPGSVTLRHYRFCKEKQQESQG